MYVLPILDKTKCMDLASNGFQDQHQSWTYAFSQQNEEGEMHDETIFASVSAAACETFASNCWLTSGTSKRSSRVKECVTRFFLSTWMERIIFLRMRVHTYQILPTSIPGIASSGSLARRYSLESPPHEFPFGWTSSSAFLEQGN